MMHETDDPEPMFGDDEGDVLGGELQQKMEDIASAMDAAPVYFAARPRKELGAELVARVDAYYQRLHYMGIDKLWAASYRAYYGLDEAGGYHKSSSVTFGGDSEEIALVKINHYRSFIRHLHVLTTKNRPAFEPQALDPSPESIRQAKLAKEVLEYELATPKLEVGMSAVAEYGFVFGEGFLGLGWESDAGEPGQDGARPGEVTADAYAPLDVIRNVSRTTANQDWFIVRRWLNRFDLLATYPEFTEEILGQTSDEQTSDVRSAMDKMLSRDGDDDEIALYEFRHERRPALPSGRHALFLGDGTVLYEGALPYKTVSLYRFAPAAFHGSCFGYSDAWDILSPQQIVDAMTSTVLTNYNAHGVQNVVMEDGTDISPADTVGGMRTWTIKPGSAAPAGINLTRMPEGILDFTNLVVGWMETLMGVNSVLRGNPGETLGKGAPAQAMALLYYAATEYNSGSQGSYVRLLENVGTGIVEMYQAFAQQPQLLDIMGPGRQLVAGSFTGAELSSIRRVRVASGNPLTRTLYGKIQIAQMYQEMGQIQYPHQLQEVFETGSLEPLTEASQREMDLIRAENEAIGKGQAPPVLIDDNHTLHMAEHRTVTFIPDARQSQQIMQAAGDHMLKHKQFLQPPMVPQGPQPGGSPPGGGPGRPQMSGKPGGPPPSAMTPLDGGGPEGTPGVGMPPLPINPATQERVQ